MEDRSISSPITRRLASAYADIAWIAFARMSANGSFIAGAFVSVPVMVAMVLLLPPPDALAERRRLPPGCWGRLLVAITRYDNATR